MSVNFVKKTHENMIASISAIGAGYVTAVCGVEFSLPLMLTGLAVMAVGWFFLCSARFGKNNCEAA